MMGGRYRSCAAFAGKFTIEKISFYINSMTHFMVPVERQLVNDGGVIGIEFSKTKNPHINIIVMQGFSLNTVFP